MRLYLSTPPTLPDFDISNNDNHSKLIVNNLNPSSSSPIAKKFSILPSSSDHIPCPTDVNISDSKRRPSTVKPNQIYHFLLNNRHYHHYFFLDRASTIATFNPKQCHHYHHELPPTPMQRFEYQSDSSQLFLPSSDQLISISSSHHRHRIVIPDHLPNPNCTLLTHDSLIKVLVTPSLMVLPLQSNRLVPSSSHSSKNQVRLGFDLNLSIVRCALDPLSSISNFKSDL